MRPLSLLWGGLAGLIAMLVLAGPTGSAIGALTAARAERASAEREVKMQREPAIVDPALAIAATNRDAANAALVRRVRQLAGKGAVLVETAEPVAGSGSLARLRVRLSGSEDAVLALADGLERGRPLTRFAAWRIEAAGSAVRLQGEMVAPWR